MVSIGVVMYWERLRITSCTFPWASKQGNCEIWDLTDLQYLNSCELCIRSRPFFAWACTLERNAINGLGNSSLNRVMNSLIISIISGFLGELWAASYNSLPDFGSPYFNCYTVETTNQYGIEADKLLSSVKGNTNLLSCSLQISYCWHLPQGLGTRKFSCSTNIQIFLRGYSEWCDGI